MDACEQKQKGGNGTAADLPADHSADDALPADDHSHVHDVGYAVSGNYEALHHRGWSSDSADLDIPPADPARGKRKGGKALKNISLPWLNCIRRPGRSTALFLLAVLLSFSVLTGSLLITGLRSGLDSLEQRLGADIMVVPYEAVTKAQLDDIILQGNPGSFYMDRSMIEKLETIDGVGQISEQFYLASTASSCCSYKVQIIGFDPDTDFTITPWVQNSYDGELGYLEVFVGHDLNAFAGDTLSFFGTEVTVAARLDRTGTYLDTAVYASEDTIRTLIQQAYEKQIYDFGGRDPDDVISCVLINVADGYNVEEVMNNINIHVRKVEAVQTQNMIQDVSYKLSGISGISGVLIVVIWLLMLVILILAFAMIANERKKEFAVLRLLGASRKRLAGILLKETLLISVAGSILGAVLSVLTAICFSNLIESALSMPFLLPGAANMALLIAGAILATVAAASVSAAVSAYRISRVDAALILRGEN